MRLFSLLLSVAAFWNPSMEPILGRQLPRDSLQQFLQVKFNPRTNISDGFGKIFSEINIAFWLPKHRNAREVWILLDINGGAPRERLRAFADAAYSDIWRPSLYHSLGWFAGTYRVLFLTVPPNFQYQNEKRWAANQRFCSMKFSMYKRSSLVEQRFSF